MRLSIRNQLPLGLRSGSAVVAPIKATEVSPAAG